MSISCKFLMCLAVTIVVSCSGNNSRNVLSDSDTAGHQDGSAVPTHRSPVEEVYVVRSRFSSPNLAVTSFCNASQFPTDYPVERERHYEYWSTSARPTDGLVTDGQVHGLGGHHGCYSVNKDGMIYSYMTGVFAGIPFTARGTCVFNAERAPQPATTPYTASFTLRHAPREFTSSTRLRRRRRRRALMICGSVETGFVHCGSWGRSMAKKNAVRITPSRGNVFRDLGFQGGVGAPPRPGRPPDSGPEGPSRRNVLHRPRLHGCFG